MTFFNPKLSAYFQILYFYSSNVSDLHSVIYFSTFPLIIFGIKPHPGQGGSVPIIIILFITNKNNIFCESRNKIDKIWFYLTNSINKCFMNKNYSILFNRTFQIVRIFSYRAFSGRQFLITYIPSVLVLAVLLIAGYVFEISMGLITRDVTAIAEIHPLSGILSSLGMILWTVSGAITAFTAFFFRSRNKVFRFLFFTSFLSFFLLFDDFFLFHEVLAPYYLGIGEPVVFLFIGISFIAYIVKFHQTILRTKFILLIMALGFLAGSMLLDMILEPWLETIGHWIYIIEDGTKWLGIASWCSYSISTSYKYIATYFVEKSNPVIENAYVPVFKESPEDIIVIDN